MSVIKPGLIILMAAVAGIMLYRAVSYGMARSEYATYLEPSSLPPQHISSAGEPWRYDVTADSSIPIQHAAQTARILKMEATPVPLPAARIDMLRYYSINERFVAWLDVKNTSIQYPVAQADDNKYYTTHSFSKKKSVSGAIFLDSFCASDLKDRCSIIYGHNMKDGSMFHDLLQYKHQWFLDSHPQISLTTLYEQLDYKVFAACTLKKEDFWWHYYSYSDTDINWLLLRIRGCAGLHASAPFPSNDAYILALATCLGDSQDRYFIVYAYRNPPKELT